jgi:hypothetical protein
VSRNKLGLKKKVDTDKLGFVNQFKAVVRAVISVM